MVKVACTVPNGITLRLYKSGYDDGTGDGVKPMVYDGDQVRLAGPSSLHTGAHATARGDIEPTLTEVDGEWWAKWIKQNENNPAVTGGHIREHREQPNPIPPA